MTDEQLNKILAESQPPKPSSALDERVMASYRKIARRPFWLRVFQARIPVPVPVAVLLGGLIAMTLFWKIPQPAMPPPRITVSVPAPVQEAAARPEPPQPPLPHARGPAAVAKLAWTPVSHPEWRIVQ